ncbi:MAG TPA: STAS domain-containing protein [Roseiflexaceae bacterium]|nr:STAS domain-containing protein [Roseiflexaceae bacterium]
MNTQSPLHPRNWRLRARLLVSMLALTLLPLLIASTLSARQTRATLTTSISADYRQQSAIRASRVAELLNEQVHLLQVLANSPRLVLAAASANGEYPADQARATATLQGLDEKWRSAPDDSWLIRRTLIGQPADELRRFQKMIPAHVEVFLTDAHGATVVATSRTTDLDQSDEDWWRAAWNNRTGAVSISQPIFDQSSSTHGLIIAVPVVDPMRQELVGVLRGTYAVKAIHDLIGIYGGPDQPHTLLIGPDDSVISSTNESEVARPLPAELAGARDDADIPDTGADGRFIFALAPVRGAANEAFVDALGWRVLIAQERSIALAPVASQLGNMVLVALPLAVVAGLTALLLGTHLARPLSQLARVAQSGDLAALAAAPVVQNRTEAGQLATSLQHLAQSVLDSRSAIEAANHSLEDTVAERTAELHAVVQQQEDLLVTQTRLLQQIADMSMPVLPVSPGVIVIPLVGTINEERAAGLSARLLEGVQEQRARVALLDITGVPLVDTQVARALMQAVAGARLLGARTLLVGVRPEIAQTLVGLGVELRGIETTTTLQEGLLRAQTLISGVAGYIRT